MLRMALAESVTNEDFFKKKLETKWPFIVRIRKG